MSRIEILELLDMFIEDCEADAKEFDGKEFSGKTLGELHGIIEAKFDALARITKQLVEDNPELLSPEKKQQ